MDIRTVPNPLIRAGGRRLRRINDRRPWSHNDHFHGWILRRLPARRRRALDVGPPLPMRDAAEPFAEISEVVRAVLPGARIRSSTPPLLTTMRAASSLAPGTWLRCAIRSWSSLVPNGLVVHLTEPTPKMLFATGSLSARTRSTSTVLVRFQNPPTAIAASAGTCKASWGIRAIDSRMTGSIARPRHRVHSSQIRWRTLSPRPRSISARWGTRNRSQNRRYGSSIRYLVSADVLSERGSHQSRDRRPERHLL